MWKRGQEYPLLDTEQIKRNHVPERVRLSLTARCILSRRIQFLFAYVVLVFPCSFYIKVLELKVIFQKSVEFVLTFGFKYTCLSPHSYAKKTTKKQNNQTNNKNPPKELTDIHCSSLIYLFSVKRMGDNFLTLKQPAIVYNVFCQTEAPQQERND